VQSANRHVKQAAGAGCPRLRRVSVFSVLGLAVIPTQAMAAEAGTVAFVSHFSVAGIALIVGGAAALLAPSVLKRDKGSEGEASRGAQPRQDLTYRGSTLKASGRRMVVAEAQDAPIAPNGPTDRPNDGKLESDVSREPLHREVLPVAAAYSASGASRYVGGLTDGVLARAKIFFAALAEQGEVDSAELARRLDAQPTELAGLLLTSLTRRAEAVSSPAPFGIGRVKGTRRRLWLDPDKIAPTLEHAIDQEIAKRHGTPGARGGFRDAPETQAIADTSG